MFLKPLPLQKRKNLGVKVRGIISEIRAVAGPGLDISLDDFRLGKDGLQSIIEHVGTQAAANGKVELAGNDQDGSLVRWRNGPTKGQNLEQGKGLLGGLGEAGDGAVVVGRFEENGDGGEDVAGGDVARVELCELVGAL